MATHKDYAMGAALDRIIQSLDHPEDMVAAIEWAREIRNMSAREHVAAYRAGIPGMGRFVRARILETPADYRPDTTDIETALLAVQMERDARKGKRNSI